MKRAVLLSLAIFALYAGWRFGVLYFDTKPEQDACSFGSVSNAKYRELLAEARKRTRTVWPRLAGTENDVADNFRTRIAELSTGATSLDERFAVVHAVMRSAGAFLHAMGSKYQDLKVPENPEDPLNVPSEVVFPYFIDSIWLERFDLVDRFARITVALPIGVDASDLHRTSLKRPIRFDEFYATISYPDSLGRVLGLGAGWVGYDANKKGFSCPPIPPADWVRVYEQWKKATHKHRDAR